MLKPDANAWQDGWIRMGVLYGLVFLLFAGSINYILPYDPVPFSSLMLLPILMWSLMYVPLLFLSRVGDWKVKDFGFSFNPLTLVVSLILVAIFSWLTLDRSTTWSGSAAEAYARTGEELFFRGFLFLLLEKLYRNKRRPWLWAAVISSFCFALIHTQTFQASFLENYGSGSIGYRIAERLFNVFLIGVAFAALRQWTKSILPGAVIHSALAAGTLTAPFVILIYAFILSWAALRKEEVVAGFARKPRLKAG
jgi:uncharacterized protein